MKDGYRVIDADGHIIEPASLWRDHIAAEFRDRAPQLEDWAFGVYLDDVEINTWAVREPEATDDARARRKERILGTYREIYPVAAARDFDATSRVDDMDVEGVDAAFLYPSFGLFALADDRVDAALAAAVARAYNEWLAEYCRNHEGRLYPIAMVPLQDPAAAAREAAYAVGELGHRGVFVRPNPVGGRNWDDPAFDPLWATMNELNVPLGLHEGGRPNLPQLGERFENLEQRHICSHPMEQMSSCVSLVYGGVLERFPRLRVVFLEAGCGWVPFWLERMDEHYENGLKRNYGASATLKMRPSEYFQRQCYVAADAEESFLAHVIDVLGDDRIVFSTDYPHPDSKFPHAVDSFLGLDDVAAESKRRILWDNALELYGVTNVAT